MEKKRVYQTPFTEVIEQVSLSAPICTSILDVEVITLGGDEGNGLNDYEYIAW